MVVRRVLRALVVERARRVRARRRLDAERARHAEMADQHRAGVEMRSEILRPAGEGGDASAFEAFAEAIGQREAQVRPPCLGAHDPRAFEHRLQPAPHGLDLGKFRHGRIAARKEFPCAPGGQAEVLGHRLADVGEGRAQTRWRRPGSLAPCRTPARARACGRAAIQVGSQPWSAVSTSRSPGFSRSLRGLRQAPVERSSAAA
jgi:hypothetical protein